MRDIAAWSLPIGRVRGITVRVHVAFLIFSVGMLLRGLHKGYAVDALVVQLILFVSVLLHEFGHCFAARSVDGDATDVLMWPLGGLAYVDVPNTPRAHLITALGGPLVNVLLCVAAVGGLAAVGTLPSPNPLWPAIVPVVETARGGAADGAADGRETVLLVTTGPLYDVRGQKWFPETDKRGALLTDARYPSFAQRMLARVFYVNWILLLLNLLPAYPLDGGRITQCLLWPRIGFRQATMGVVYAGYVVAGLMLIFVLASSETGDPSGILLFALGLFILFTCRQQAYLLETGALGEESVFGYDFSQGYSSLERDQAPARRRPNFWQRWRQRRAAMKRQQEEERRASEERRVDELLAKVQQGGLNSLTDEERRFLTRVSARYRNRNA